MTDHANGDGGEGFLGRWSRMKRETRPATPSATEEPRPGADRPVANRPVAEPSPPEPALEPAPALDLPPLDSLGAGSDYTGFLRSGVPAELRRQALRKAWVSDPAIADFRGFADYDWDLNAPGYGALWPTDNVAALLEAIFPSPAPPSPAPEDGEPPAAEPTEPAATVTAELAPEKAGGAGDADDARADPPAEPQTQRPPSTSRQTPVRNAASSEQR